VRSGERNIDSHARGLHGPGPRGAPPNNEPCRRSPRAPGPEPWSDAPGLTYDRPGDDEEGEWML